MVGGRWLNESVLTATRSYVELGHSSSSLVVGVVLSKFDCKEMSMHIV